MRALFAVAVLAGLAFPAAAAPPDDQARRLIVGDWIASPYKSDTAGAPQEALNRVLARYNPDGTGHIQVFSDAACSRIAFTRAFRWTIAQGVVQTVAPEGRRTSDQIVTIDSQTMTLRLAGTSGLEHRVRAATCARQMGV
ncbi:MAG: hypothetical protein JWP16_1978 [Alphaproteobacteria bacterium]|nr:hypothetical protein [Alphaproteobacteria bacterium]MDB5740938.1 hypothetical protein [Alphaproteobacteria bacterium]